ncbi:hypothetical protein [Clostridium novyi]|uniref:hypothetical protein n=1 Tax=Clostridium novyi TaxID=1542 RepID=UPI000B28F8C9
MNSDNGFLSQDEIDSLLNGGGKDETQEQSQENVSNVSYETKVDEKKKVQLQIQKEIYLVR